MTEDKGLSPAAADAIGEYVCRNGLRDLLSDLQSNTNLTSNASAKKGLEDMELLLNYLEAFEVLDKVSFDLSLARGLDYYTGVIYEVVTEGSAPSATASAGGKPHRAKRRPKPSSSTIPDGEGAPTEAGAGRSTAAETKDDADDDDEDRSADPSVGVGSIAAGGRYDGLVGMFSGKGQIPCVGISFGLDRIFSLTKSRLSSSALSTPPKIRATEVEVYIMAFGGKGFDGMLVPRMQVAKLLWEGGVKAEFAYKVKPKLPAQFKAAEADDVPFAVILGEDEQARGQVKIKELGLPDGHPEKDGVFVDINNLVSEVKDRLRRKREDEETVTDAKEGHGAETRAGPAEKEQQARQGQGREESVAEGVDGLKLQ